jgi:hypothetical protein
MQAFAGPQQGTAEIGTLIVIKKDISAASDPIAIFTADAPYGFTVLDVIVECTATNSSGAVTLTDGTTAITDAITMATNKAITRAGTIDDAKATIAAGGSLVADKNASADEGVITILAVRTT